jgi:putative ABC transport system permease protein
MTRRTYRRLLDLRLGGWTRVDAEMDLEIESHLAMRIADLVQSGMSPDDARRDAMRRFGDFDNARRRLHSAARQRDAAVRQRDWLRSYLADLRYALRQVRRAPAFATVAVLTLALGIGATAAMFTLLDHVLLRSMPFVHAEQLVSLAGLDSARNHVPTVSSADWQDWRRGNTPALDGVALAAVPWRLALASGDSATQVTATRVSGNFFSVLRARFAAGRSFAEDEANAGQPIVVVSDRVWRNLLDGDATLAAPLRTLKGSFKVVGVVAAGQEFPAGTDVWFPAAFRPEGPGLHNNINWIATGRLTPGATAAQASAQLAVVESRIRASDPSAVYAYGVDVRPLRDEIVGDVGGYLKLLMGVVGVVLLIVCANVSAAGLGRASTRSREMAVRVSLGAARGRLVQQLLIEHVLLGLLGGLIGLFLAWAGVRGLLAAWGNQIPRADEVVVDAPIFIFSFVASVFAGMIAGLIPAIRVSNVSLRGMLASGGRTAARGGKNIAGSTLVATEIALAVLLLTGAGLLIQSFRSVLGRGLGFTTNVATAGIGLPTTRYGTDSLRRQAYWKSLIASYRAIPGVQSAGVTAWLPLGPTGQTFIDVNGRELGNAGVVYRPVSDDFLATLGVPLIVGRMLGPEDGPSSARVVVINRLLARTYWPNESPIGKQIRARSMEQGAKGAPAPWLTIVGVVGDVRTWSLEADPRPEMYVSFLQAPQWMTSTMTAVVRANVPADRLLGEMRKRARALEPRTAPELSTLDIRLRDRMAQRRMMMTLLAGFAGLALVLAALGIYGVLSYSVAQRTRELAVRAALGAQRRQLLGLVVRAGLRVVAIGAAAGVVAGVALTRTMSAMLVDVAPNDPVTYAGALVVLGLVALAAILIPSFRATRLDPNIALQAE